MEMIVRILGIIAPVLLIGAIGFAYGRLRRPDMSGLNRLLTELLFPLLIFTSMASQNFHLPDYLVLMSAGVLLTLGSGAIAWAIARTARFNPHAFIPPMMFSNTGNMGLPLTLFAFGADVLPAAVSLFVIITLMHFTIGIRICAPHASIRGILRGPMLWATVLGVICSLSGAALPAWLESSAKMLGETAIPLGLFALGVGFSGFRITQWTAGLVGAFVRPLSGLLIAWPLGHWLPLSPEMQKLLLLYAVLPPAVMNYLFAEHYRQEPALVSAIVVVGNLASLAFIPLALYLAFA